MRAKPNEVSTRNESFSKPTIVPMTLLPSFRRISSARVWPAAKSKETTGSARINLPRMISSMTKRGIDGQGLGTGKFPRGHGRAEYFKFQLRGQNAASIGCPNSCGEFFHRVKSKLLVKPHGAFVAGSYRKRYLRKAAHAQGLQRRFHQAATETPALVSGHGADLRGVADSFGHLRIQDHADQMVFMRSAQHKRSLRLKLSAAGQDNNVFQETQRTGFAAVLVVNFTIHVICIGKLDQARARLKIAVVPALQDQSSARSFPDQSW